MQIRTPSWVERAQNAADRIVVQPAIRAASSATHLIQDKAIPAVGHFTDEAVPVVQGVACEAIKVASKPIELSTRGASEVAKATGHEAAAQKLNHAADTFERGTENVAERASKALTIPNATKLTATIVGGVLLGPLGAIAGLNLAKVAQSEEVTEESLATDTIVTVATMGVGSIAGGVLGDGVLSAMVGGGATAATAGTARVVVKSAIDETPINPDELRDLALREAFIGGFSGGVSTAVAGNETIVDNAFKSAAHGAAKNAAVKIVDELREPNTPERTKTPDSIH